MVRRTAMGLKRRVCNIAKPLLNRVEVLDDLCEEKEEPSDGDYVWDDAHSSLSEVGGRFLGKFEDQDAAEEFAKRRMEREEFWPDFWWLSDHGNLHIVSFGR